jgi:hypothetical protein
MDGRRGEAVKMAGLLVQVLIYCLVCGVAFAALATWLTTRKGNTISDILKAKGLDGGQAEAISLEIMDKFKLRSSIPVVGLYTIGALVASAVPLYVAWGTVKEEQATNEIRLHGTLIAEPNPDPSSELPFRNLRFEYPHPIDQKTGVFDIFVPYVESPEPIDVTGGRFQPFAVQVTIDKQKNSVKIAFPGNYPQSSLGTFIIKEDHSAEIGNVPIRLTPTSNDTAVLLKPHTSNAPSEMVQQAVFTFDNLSNAAGSPPMINSGGK